MHQFRQSRTSLFATAAIGCMLLMNGAAEAQTVRIFDEAPSVEQLRTIMIPESHGGATRSIVLLRPSAAASTGIVQVAAAQSATPSGPAATRAAPAENAAPVSNETAAAPAPARPVAITIAPRIATPIAPTIAPRDVAHEAGIVGFRINFALDSAAVPGNADVFIDRMAELMKLEPQVKLRIEGHTDALGTAEYNQLLSERRAASVADYLVRHCGIAAERLVITGKGMTEPMTKDRNDGQNRRVQFVRIG